MSGINPDKTKKKTAPTVGGGFDSHSNSLMELQDVILNNPPATGQAEIVSANDGKRTVTSSYASAASFANDESNVLFWHDFVEEDKTSADLIKKISEYESVISALRNHAVMSQDNRVIVPDNVAQEFPYFQERLRLAADLTASRLVADPSKRISLLHPKVWSTDPDQRNSAIADLKQSAKPKDVIGVFDLATLIDALGVLPTESSLDKNEPAKKAHAHLLLTIAGIFAEQKWNTPLASTKKWWKVQTDLRDMLKSEIGPLVGGPLVADQIINAITILYRRFLRVSLNSKENPKAEELKSYLQRLLAKLSCEGSALFNRLLRQEVYVKEVEVPDPNKKGTKSFMKIKRSCKRVIRPRLAEGPMSECASAALTRVNKVLSTIEADAEQLIGAAAFNHNLPLWEKTMNSWVQQLYTRTAAFNRIIHDRKQYIRNSIFERRLTQRAQAGKLGLVDEFKKGITPLEWTDTWHEIMTRDRDTWCAKEHEAFAILLHDTRNFGDIVSISEEDLQRYFLGIFSDLKDKFLRSDATE